MVAVAVRGILLSAQDAGDFLTCQVKQLLDAFDEPAALYQCGIADFVDIIGSFGRDDVMLITGGVLWATSQRFTRPGIIDAICLENLLEGSLVELGMEAAVGCAAYIHQAGDRLVKQQPDQFVNRMAAVTNREEFNFASYIPTSATAVWKAK